MNPLEIPVLPSMKSRYPEPKDGPNGRRRDIHWVGPKDRYRLIHINEWGTIKNPNPAGKGKVAASLKAEKKLIEKQSKRYWRRFER